MALIAKKWFFSISPDPLKADSLVRHQWKDWETAKAEALRRGGIAEEEMIEISETQVGDVVVRATTGTRSYRYYDGKRETSPRILAAGADYYADRRSQEETLKAARR